MNNIENSYLNLLSEIIQTGESREDRTGTGTISVFGGNLKHNMALGFPLLTTKKMSLKNIFTELKWFISGDTNIKYLVDNNCNIWNGDCFKHFQKTSGNPLGLTQQEFIREVKNNPKFAKKWGNLGKIYGYQWIKANQLNKCLQELKNNPHGRRHIVMAWDAEDINDAVLPPCHIGFQCYINQEGLSMKFFMRSSDVPLGLPYNIASYGMLLLMMAKSLGVPANTLEVSLGDSHIYLNQLEGVLQQVNRKPLPPPKISLLTKRDTLIDYEFSDFLIEDYHHHPEIKFPLSN